MPFRSKRQRTFLRINHPAIYRRWKREHGTRIVPSPRKRSAPRGGRRR